MFNKRNKGMMGATRWVEMELNQGICINNYYWLEGPPQGDTGSIVESLVCTVGRSRFAANA